MLAVHNQRIEDQAGIRRHHRADVLQIYRGQRGRMEIRITTAGVSCHGSAPERGDNAIYKMAAILLELRALNENLISHPFLGKGSLTVSEIFFTSPSRCAVADSCWISVDRRLTAGEDKEYALGQIRDLPSVKAAGAEVSMYGYERPSYTGLVYPTECYFPTWFIEEDHPVCRTLCGGLQEAFPQPAGARQMDVLHQRRIDHGHARDTLHRLRPGARRPGARPERKDVEG